MKVLKWVMLVTFVLSAPAAAMAWERPLSDVLGKWAIKPIIADVTKEIIEEKRRQGLTVDAKAGFRTDIVDRIGDINVPVSAAVSADKAKILLEYRYRQFLLRLIESVKTQSVDYGPQMSWSQGYPIVLYSKMIDMYLRDAPCGTYPCKQGCKKGNPCTKTCDHCP